MSILRHSWNHGSRGWRRNFRIACVLCCIASLASGNVSLIGVTSVPRGVSAVLPQARGGDLCPAPWYTPHPATGSVGRGPGGATLTSGHLNVSLWRVPRAQPQTSNWGSSWPCCLGRMGMFMTSVDVTVVIGLKLLLRRLRCSPMIYPSQYGLSRCLSVGVITPAVELWLL